MTPEEPEPNEGDLPRSTPSEAPEATLHAWGKPTFFHPSERPQRQPGLGPRPGDVVGEFRLLGLLGQGGMGQVWEAEQQTLGDRRVALKLVRPDRLSEQGVERFLREARAGGRLQHPGIVAVHDAGVADGVHWISQELVEGGCTLADYLREPHGQQHRPRAFYLRLAHLIQRIAEALQTAHEGGVIHRDLKPQNVLITGLDQPKVTDFGLARIQDETRLTNTGEVAGTFAYMSPEQLSDLFGTLDHRSDVFSLGVVMYQLLTLSLPFPGATGQQVLYSIVHAEPKPLRSLRRDVPEDLAVICMKALEKRPGDRFGSMGELAEELERFRRSEVIETRPASAIHRLRKWSRRHPTLTTGTLVSLAGAVAVAVLLRAVGATALERDLERKNRLIAQAEQAFGMGAAETAEQLLDEAAGIDPEDPRVDLVATAHRVRHGERGEGARSLRRAIEKGFDPDPASAGNGYEWLGSALNAQIEGGALQAEAVASRLRAALDAEDPPLSANYLLYQALRSMGDRDAAERALLDYAARLPAGERFQQVLSAELLELNEDWTGALELLEQLWQETTPGQRAELRLARKLGRLSLQTRHLEPAEDRLREAVEEHPADAASWVNLATLELLFWEDATHDPEDDERPRLERMRALARRGLEQDPHLPGGWAAWGFAAQRLLELDLATIRYEEAPEWSEVREALDRLRELQPDHPQRSILAARHAHLRGHVLAREERTEEAATWWSRCLDEDPSRLTCLVNLVESLLQQGRPTDALVRLERASELLGPRAPSDLQVLVFEAADGANEVDRALDARDELLRQLDDGAEIGRNTLLRFAGALASAQQAELVDCDLALFLVGSYELERIGADPEAQAVLAEIRSSCRDD